MSKIKLTLLLVLVSANVCLSQVSPKKLLKQHKKALSPYEGSDKMNGRIFSMIGKMRMGDIEGDVSIVVSERKMRLEFNMLGADFYSVTNDSLTWSYNPLKKAFEFEISKEKDSGEGQFMDEGRDKLSNFIEQGYKPTTTNSVKLDSINAYELILELEDDRKSFFFDKETYYLIGHKWAQEEEYYLNHEEFENMLLPKTHISVTEGGLIFNFEKYSLENQVDVSLFEMNKDEEEAYQRYLSEQNLNTNSSSSVQEYYDQGVALMNEGKNEEAITFFDQGLELNNNDAVILNSRGLAKSKLANYYGAVADYERALEARPDFAEATNNLGLAKYNLGDIPGAIKDYEKALELDSTNSVFYSNMGLAYFKQPDYEKAVQFFNSAIELDATKANYYYLRGVSRAQTENYLDAVGDYKKSIEMGIRHQYVYNHYGVTLSNLGEYKMALEMFEKAHQVDNTNAQFLENIAEMQRSLEQYQSSIETYNKIIALDTTLAYGYASRAISEYDLGLIEPAFKDINKAIDMYNENALYYDYRAYIKEEMSDFAGAMEDFSKSLSIEVDSNIYYRRGLVKIKMSDKTGACQDFKQAADMEDENGKSALLESCNF